MQNQPNTLTKQNIIDWRHNLLVFIAPVAVIYLTSTVYVIQTPGNIFSLNDFIPSSFTVGGMVLYLLNSGLDLLRKYLGPS